MAASSIDIRLSSRIENREKYWAAKNDQFGITAYGRSEDEAVARVWEAVELMLNRLKTERGMDAVRAHLARLDIPWVEVPDEPPLFTRSQRTQRVGSPMTRDKVAAGR